MFHLDGMVGRKRRFKAEGASEARGVLKGPKELHYSDDSSRGTRVGRG